MVIYRKQTVASSERKMKANLKGGLITKAIVTYTFKAISERMQNNLKEASDRVCAEYLALY